MRVIVEGRALQLEAKDVVGQGGEAIVYRSSDRAIKLFQGLSPDALAEKGDKIRDYPRSVPGGVIAPLAAAYDTRGMLVGYAMRFLDGARDGQRVSARGQRGGVRDAGAVTSWLTRLATLLDAVHAAGIVVGDLNDGNVLEAQGAAWIIDADSHQFGPYGCRVAHERFLDPRLYGIDLSRVQALSRESDHYAFAVLAFSAWLGVHPYGGVHPKLGTLMRRAEARVSVLRPEVRRPKVAAEPDALPERTLEWFARVFEGDLRERMPAPLLGLAWTRCSCGLEHARPSCPRCRKQGVIRARPSAERHGRVRAVSVFVGRRVISAKSRGGALEYLAVRADGAWIREDGTSVPASPGAQVALGGRRTYLARGGQLAIVEGGVLGRTLPHGGGFDAHGARAVCLDGDHLVELEGGARIGSILEGATSLHLGDSMGYGYYRAGRHTEHFSWRTGRPGLTSLPLPSIEGRLLSHRAQLDGGALLVAWQEERGGRELAHRHLLVEGRLVASLVGPPDASPLLATASGFALSRGRLLFACDRGILSVEVDGGALVPGSLFVDAEPFVHEGCEILAGPGGSLFVVTEDRITQLVLEGA